MIVVIDGLNQFIRNWFVCPHLSKNGLPIGGIIGTLRTTQKALRQLNPSQVIVCWDGHEGSARRRGLEKR